MKVFRVSESSVRGRLDVFLVANLPELSRASIGKLIDQGKVTVNGTVATKTGQKVREGDEISIDYDISELSQIPEIDLSVLYEDDDCVVIDKPVGVLSHSKGAFNPEGTVATWLRERVKGLSGERGGIVHRLDRATSGVMICAKTPEALVWLQKQFSQRKVKKSYKAITEGELNPSEAVIDMPIERNPKAPATFRVGANGKSAVTQYKVIEVSDMYSLVELKPETGRTHQLRVHLAHQGHPILGDSFYGGKPAERLYLHAESLEITLPNRERRIFQSKLPVSFRAKLKEN